MAEPVNMTTEAICQSLSSSQSLYHSQQAFAFGPGKVDRINTSKGWREPPGLPVFKPGHAAVAKAAHGCDMEHPQNRPGHRETRPDRRGAPGGMTTRGHA